jgi:hypothetical protein
MVVGVAIDSHGMLCQNIDLCGMIPMYGNTSKKVMTELYSVMSSTLADFSKGKHEMPDELTRHKNKKWPWLKLGAFKLSNLQGLFAKLPRMVQGILIRLCLFCPGRRPS